MMNLLRRLFGKQTEPEGRVPIKRASNYRALDATTPPAYVRIHVRESGTIGQRKTMALVACPNGHRFAIGPRHEIDRAGRVDAPVACPQGDCGWVHHVRLEGWAS